MSVLHFYHGSNVGRNGIALVHPPTTPIPHTRPSVGNRGGRRVRQRVWGGWEESVVNLPSAKNLFIAAMLFRDEDEKGTVLFHSGIFNSVCRTVAEISVTVVVTGVNSRILCLYSLYYNHYYYYCFIKWSKSCLPDCLCTIHLLMHLYFKIVPLFWPCTIEK